MLPHDAASAPVLFVIDDNPAALELYREQLYKAAPDLDVRTYSDPVRACDDALKAPPDVVVTDWNMPRLNGSQVVAKIRSLADWDVPVVLVSGFLDPVQLARQKDVLMPCVAVPKADGAEAEGLAEACRHAMVLGRREMRTRAWMQSTDRQLRKLFAKLDEMHSKLDEVLEHGDEVTNQSRSEHDRRQSDLEERLLEYRTHTDRQCADLTALIQRHHEPWREKAWEWAYRQVDGALQWKKALVGLVTTLVAGGAAAWYWLDRLTHLGGP